ncbi:hypothetical protein [Nonomuraea dietziae]|uniref:hypothetical protein n=1 Tax=Nonomuraea dietziae TaxID=65515 RepID=UPI00341DF4BC
MHGVGRPKLQRPDQLHQARAAPLEGHESARSRGKPIGGAAVTDDAMLSMALHLREQNLSLRDIAWGSWSSRS